MRDAVCVLAWLEGYSNALGMACSLQCGALAFSVVSHVKCPGIN